MVNNINPVSTLIILFFIAFIICNVTGLIDEAVTHYVIFLINIKAICYFNSLITIWRILAFKSNWFLCSYIHPICTRVIVILITSGFLIFLVAISSNNSTAYCIIFCISKWIFIRSITFLRTFWPLWFTR